MVRRVDTVQRQFVRRQSISRSRIQHQRRSTITNNTASTAPAQPITTLRQAAVYPAWRRSKCQCRDEFVRRRARHGRRAAINLQMKSGSNSFHGSLFEDHSTSTSRPTRTLPIARSRSRNTSTTNTEEWRRPIKKNKLFYFLSFEATGVRQENAVYSRSDRCHERRQSLRRAEPDLRSADRQCRRQRADRVPRQHNSGVADRSGIQAVIAPGLWPNPDVPGPAPGAFPQLLERGNTGQSRYRWTRK